MIGVRCCVEVMIRGDHTPKQTLKQQQLFDSNLQDIPQHKITNINAMENNGVATRCNQFSSLT